MTTYTSEPGTRLGGRYRLEDRIAAGSGWAAWKAIDETLARAVTVFTFAPGFPRVGDVVTAARAASRLTDPRLAQVFDVEDAWERAYIVMEWAAGETLGDMLSQGPLEPFRAGRMIAEAAAALSSAHAAGVAHMCLSPGSVRWSQTGEVKVVGLGIDAALSGTTADDPVLADTVGLGRLLYAALTGYWPGHDYPSLPPAPLVDGLPCSPRQVIAGVPLAISDLTSQAMQIWSREGSRLATPDQLARALLAALPPTPPPAPDSPVWRPAPARRGWTAAQGDYEHLAGAADDRYWGNAGAEQAETSRSSSRGARTTRHGRQRVGRHGSRQAGWQERSPIGDIDGIDGDALLTEQGEGDFSEGLAQRGSRRAETTGPLPRLRQAFTTRPVRKPVAVVAGAGVVASVAVAAFVLLPRGGHAPPATGPTGKAKTPGTALTSLPIAGASGFDPLTSVKRDPGNEDSQTAPYAIDGSIKTAWQSQWYATAEFGGLKRGSGLILDMGKQVTFSSVTVTFGSTPGADVELLVGNSDARSAANLNSMTQIAARSDATGTITFPITKSVSGRFLVIWYTKLPPRPGHSGEFEAEVFNVAVKGTA